MAPRTKPAAAAAASAPASAPPAPAPVPAPAAPAVRWFEFVGPYPVVVSRLGLEVAPGDRVAFPDGAPDATNWRPAPAPTPEDEES